MKLIPKLGTAEADIISRMHKALPAINTDTTFKYIRIKSIESGVFEREGVSYNTKLVALFHPNSGVYGLQELYYDRYPAALLVGGVINVPTKPNPEDTYSTADFAQYICNTYNLDISIFGTAPTDDVVELSDMFTITTPNDSLVFTPGSVSFEATFLKIEMEGMLPTVNINPIFASKSVLVMNKHKAGGVHLPPDLSKAMRHVPIMLYGLDFDLMYRTLGNMTGRFNSEALARVNQGIKLQNCPWQFTRLEFLGGYKLTTGGIWEDYGGVWLGGAARWHTERSNGSKSVYATINELGTITAGSPGLHSKIQTTNRGYGMNTYVNSYNVFSMTYKFK